ncbi:hypothetical protein LVD15_22210 [Fulvivirga maritima]|uniref:hypothetical protein n=1 Tax=Fulvivirga maritima TaxID=2904247 RepID=UPI001F3AFEC7|nr:hypothetical protein [Fulvivirga maritima]UII25989.1 hypothetical protein LVD15_22210 [Fulvivirga maritima]
MDNSEKLNTLTDYYLNLQAELTNKGLITLLPNGTQEVRFYKKSSKHLATSEVLQLLASKPDFSH